MKSVIVIASSILLCSCADMYVTRTEGGYPRRTNRRRYRRQGLRLKGRPYDYELRGRGERPERHLYQTVLCDHILEFIGKMPPSSQ